MEIVAQVFGIFTLVAIVIGLLSKTKGKRLIWFIISNLFLLATYFVLGRYLGSILVFIATVRFIVYYIYTKNNWKKSAYVLIFFELAFVIASAFMWQGLPDILLILTFCLLTYANWQDNKNVFNILYIITVGLSISYNILVGAYLSNLTEIVLLATIIFSIIRDKKNTK